MSYGVQSASLFGSTSQTGGSPGPGLAQFANLDLTEEQRKQIRSIFKSAKSDGTSETEIQQQINAILTPTQQATYQNDLSSQSSAPPAPPPPPPGSQSGSSTGGDILSNLSLTSDQQSQIDTILQNARTSNTPLNTVLTQIEAILTPAQQSALLQDVQTAQAYVSGQSQSGSGGTAAIFSSGVTAADVQNQIAAATSLILQQFQADVSTNTTTT